jgi:hypothetical protein
VGEVNHPKIQLLEGIIKSLQANPKFASSLHDIDQHVDTPTIRASDGTWQQTFGVVKDQSKGGPSLFRG